MCPACIGIAALIAGSATTTGGVAALFIKKFYAKNVANKIRTQTRLKEKRNGQ
jgi:hypothetical protein